jgi:hypothetical protein
MRAHQAIHTPIEGFINKTIHTTLFEREPKLGVNIVNKFSAFAQIKFNGEEKCKKSEKCKC